eukprot:275556-Karenia_brevis.AAC.1
MIAGHQELRIEANFTDAGKWKKIDECYQRGTLHYAVPHLLHHKILTTPEVMKVIARHDASIKEYGHDLRKMTMIQGRMLKQM